jgi:hypothetical protein
MTASATWISTLAMPPGSGLGLVLEPFQMSLIEHRPKGEDLQSHFPMERNLLRLVDHPHPIPVDLPNNAKVAQALRRAPASLKMAPVNHDQAFLGRLPQPQPKRHRPPA